MNSTSVALYFTPTIPLTVISSRLHANVKDDASLNAPIFHSISQRYPRRNNFPSECFYNSWIIAIDKEEPIMEGDVIDTLNHLRKNSTNEVSMQLHKRTAYNGILLN